MRVEIFNTFKNSATQALAILSICILSMSLGACTDDNSDLKTFMKDVRALEPRSIDPIPKLIPLPKFLFPVGINRRNPFKPSAQERKMDPFAPDQHRKKQPLEEFPLDALKFVGNIKQGRVLWALIKQPGGKIDFVKVGDYMGKNYGRIIVIKSDFIKIEETTKDSGKWDKHITTLNLQVGK